jgi:hypothetical protein
MMAEKMCCTWAEGDGCEKELTKKVYDYSMKTYSVALCFDHQKLFREKTGSVVAPERTDAKTEDLSDTQVTGKLEASPEEVKKYADKTNKELNIKPVTGRSGHSVGNPPKLKDAIPEKVQMKASIPSEYIISIQGKEFITHSGLLTMTHKLGIKSVNTDIISDLNAETIICKTTLILKDDRVFTGLGDANKENTNAMIGPHKIRMAETRSFNRAMRFATNTGMCSADELGGQDKR